ncbi:MAG: glutamate synthase large subunit [Candidatus Kapabacteria bacterium]|jgi:glutamate synthase domain-containing protein 2/glutamate synthase domain-containing protein 1/glutamate synthase domain-containing protein 3|nr:glutamate synthase large subunit [Candidatus Kapabacteria bacterium]
MSFSTLPPKQGLYDPAFERDACGVGFVANLSGKPSRDIVTQGLKILKNLKHRGATGCDPHTGDGAGILTQIPHDFFRRVCREPQNILDGGFELPAAGQYGVGMVFLPALADERKRCETLIQRRLEAEGLRVLGWRNPPINDQVAGDVAKASQPAIRQVFVAAPHLTQEQLEIKLYVARQMMAKEIVRLGLQQGHYFYMVSFSTRTICYKGLLQPEQIDSYYIDLKARDFVSALALVHQRFSTNTFPSWALSHPFRYIAHNGEINTLRGNVNWMRAREAMLESPLFGDDIKKIKPIITESGSDSAILDNALELLVLSGRSVPHALMMLVPEAWEAKADMSEELRAFYQYHSTLSEPWDGPAAISFTDGLRIGTALDRNGLRPARFLVTSDGIVAMASETGVLDFAPETIIRKGRVEPGSMMIADLAEGRVLENDEIKHSIASRQPYADYVKSHVIRLDNLSEASPELALQPNLSDKTTLLEQQQAFGYSDEDVRVILQPMAQNGEEPIGSMGTDTPLAVLSEKPQLLPNYFKQLFAQVTNPPIDPLRERSVMSLKVYTGRRGKFLNEDFDPLRCDLELDSPILTDEELAKIKSLDGMDASVSRGMSSATLSTLFPIAKGAEGLVKALTSLCEQAEAVIEEGHALLILSDRGVNKTMAPIPALLAVSAVHHHLIKTGKRTQVGLIVESGEPREVMHFALLIGYGASAINPYLALGTIKHSFAPANAIATVHGAELTALGSVQAMTENYRKAIGKGLLKIMSKMGISTLMSYRGAQIFEAVGLSSQLIDNYFPRTPSRLEGIDLRHITRDIERFHKAAFPAKRVQKPSLTRSGLYQWQRDGEFHAYNPASIHALQKATQTGNYEEFKRYSALVNTQQKKNAMLRGLLEFKKADSIPLSEVEPVETIMKRFATGAMSFGSISAEAHETLAVAMNTIGGKSNTGEGGEDAARFVDNRRSAIKQVASGRFGVTSHYLVNADELQIKVAQGAKPGEGGQLPGHKVDGTIARVRHSVPGVTLISPPPHHDIYSIEDLAQLIFDLKNANARAAISVKLVSEVGVGVVAAGVAKAHADMILISGYDGGTGASPISSTRHAGIPWELGLAETQQTLVLNDLRGRVRVQVDGQMKTGRDVAIAALLGAEEFGFSTAPLVVSGCILMRKCHLNTCPVGIATQKPELREKFTGKAEHIINFFRFIAEEVREIMAELGFRTMDEMIGRSDLLKPASDLTGKAATLDLAPILYNPAPFNAFTNTSTAPNVQLRCLSSQEHGLETALDHELLKKAHQTLQDGTPTEFTLPIKNVHRTVGTMLGSEISRRFGEQGLPEDTIQAHFKGTAGQSFGAFIPRGVTMRLEGEGNDYVGKGLSGGKIIIVPHETSTFAAEENVIAGNTLMYGATSGQMFIRGQVGERFSVRNSGATVVVEGVGDHACEYMTGGTVVVLGKTGRNFAAGMSGGLACIYDPHKTFALRCNHEMVDVVNVLDEEQRSTLHALISLHAEYTGSAIARRILDSWATSVQDFALVFPHEYRKYLQRTRPQPAPMLVELSKELALEENFS